MSAKILIVEDDTSIATGLALNLRVEGYTPLVASDGDAGQELALSERPALIILDLALPKKNGLEVLAELRAAGDVTPIIILSARDAEHDVVAALKLGADDYVSKPFGLAELLARVSAVLRRAQLRAGISVAPASEPAARAQELRFGEICIGLDTRVVMARGKEVKLTRLEFDLLLYLAKNPGKVFSRDRLLREVWEVNHDGSPRTVDNFIAQLRGKIEVDPDNPRHLVTVRGAGYRLDT